MAKSEGLRTIERSNHKLPCVDEREMTFLCAAFRSMAVVTDYGDPNTEGHLERVSIYTMFVAQQVLGWTQREATTLEIASMLHDVGKVTLPRQLLLRPAALSQSERLLQQHAKYGYEIITKLERDIHSTGSDLSVFQYAKEVARSHHENWDGSGYPDRLQGDCIPISARIVKLTDVIDALLSRRPYKKPWPWPKVRENIARLANVEFDGRLVTQLLKKEHEFLQLVKSLNEPFGADLL